MRKWGAPLSLFSVRCFFPFLVSHWFKSCPSFKLGSWGWAGLGPRFENGWDQRSGWPDPIAHPLPCLLNLARLGLGKFFSEIRLSPPSSPLPNLLPLREKGWKVRKQLCLEKCIQWPSIVLSWGLCVHPRPLPQHTHPLSAQEEKGGSASARLSQPAPGQHSRALSPVK